MSQKNGDDQGIDGCVFMEEEGTGELTWTQGRYSGVGLGKCESRLFQETESSLCVGKTLGKSCRDNK